MTYGKIFWVLYVCLVPPEVEPGNGESKEMSGIPKNALSCHGGRRVTRRQPDLAIVCIQVRVHVMPSRVFCDLSAAIPIIVTGMKTCPSVAFDNTTCVPGVQSAHSCYGLQRGIHSPFTSSDVNAFALRITHVWSGFLSTTPAALC